MSIVERKNSILTLRSKIQYLNSKLLGLFCGVPFVIIILLTIDEDFLSY